MCPLPAVCCLSTLLTTVTLPWIWVCDQVIIWWLELTNWKSTRHRTVSEWHTDSEQRGNFIAVANNLIKQHHVLVCHPQVMCKGVEVYITCKLNASQPWTSFQSRGRLFSVCTSKTLKPKCLVFLESADDRLSYNTSFNGLELQIKNHLALLP